MTFGFWTPRVKASKTLEYLYPSVYVKVNFRGSIASVDLTLTFGCHMGFV